jgi:methyl-accepting chemotaxis protein
MLKDMKIKNRIIALTALNSVLFIILYAVLVITTGIDAMNGVVLGGLALVIILAIVFTLRIIKSFDAPLERMSNILKKVSEGDMEARIGLKSNDEFGNMSKSIDTMLNERMTSTSDVEDENETLNDSIVTLLETVAQLAQKDLTVRAKVSEDITGPIADALNMMSSETSIVLTKVLSVAEEVAETSNLVKSQADNVILLADNERNEVEQTVTELKSAADTMAKINTLAEASNTAAEDAIKTTITAMASVTETVGSIGTIRDTIRETEKRIKRLGERSQEISTAVNLINNISERTHILALNASMHAASAGEAGRGFAVVADEVQRLAESSREATSEIATLVKNIQLETSSTVNTMNELTSQVVVGSKLAEQAGMEMEETQSTTANLVEMVQKISEGASMQSRRSRQLRERADVIRNSVRKTGDHLKEQTNHTDELVQQALSLVAAVSVFTLNEDDKDTVVMDVNMDELDMTMDTAASEMDADLDLTL